MKKLFQLFSAILLMLTLVGCVKPTPEPEPEPTPTSTTLTDIDGNIYDVVSIGTQAWMNKNLNVSKYKNGDIIPQVEDRTQWLNLNTGAWCYYDNKVANGGIYGKLYNWYAIIDPRGIAPAGYHIPTIEEWTKLTNYLGNDSIAGGKMKEAGFIHWDSPNYGANNNSNFSGLPGGYRNQYGNYFNIGFSGYWWSSSEKESTIAKAISLKTNYYQVITSDEHFKISGLSVRCVKD